MMNPHSRSSQRKTLTVVATAVLLAGCAALAPAPKTWRVAANYRIDNAGTSTELGYQALARQFEGERRWREARDAWRKAALAAPEDADIQNALGLAEASQGQYGKAVAALRRAVAVAPERAQLLNNLGYALLLDGQSVEAKSVLQEALTRSPDHRLARANLDRIDQVAGGVNPRSIVDSPPLPSGEASAHGPASQLQTLPNVEPLQLRQARPTETSDVPEVSVAVRAVAAPNHLTTETPLSAQPTQPPAPPATASATTTPPPRIEIVNGNGVTGMATWLSGWLRARGLAQNTFLSNAQPFNTMTTVMHYRTGYLTAAQALAERLPYRVEVATEPGGAANADVRVVLGRDLRAAGEPVKRTPVQAKSTLKPGWPAG